MNISKRIAKKKRKLKIEERKEAASCRRDRARALIRNFLSSKGNCSKGSLEQLKMCTHDELLFLRRTAYSKFKTSYGKRRESLKGVMARIDEAEKYHEELIRQRKLRDGSEIRNEHNRRAMARAVKNHPLGSIVGRTKVAEYRSPGSSSWATPRISRK